MSTPEVIIHRDASLLAKAAAARLVTRLVDAVGARGRESGHHVHARAVKCPRIFKRSLDSRAKLRFSPRQAGDAAIPSCPVSRRSVEQHLGKAMRLQP